MSGHFLLLRAMFAICTKYCVVKTMGNILFAVESAVLTPWCTLAVLWALFCVLVLENVTTKCWKKLQKVLKNLLLRVCNRWQGRVCAKRIVKLTENVNVICYRNQSFFVQCKCKQVLRIKQMILLDNLILLRALFFIKSMYTCQMNGWGGGRFVLAVSMCIIHFQ